MSPAINQNKKSSTDTKNKECRSKRLKMRSKSYKMARAKPTVKEAEKKYNSGIIF